MIERASYSQPSPLTLSGGLMQDYTQMISCEVMHSTPMMSQRCPVKIMSPNLMLFMDMEELSQASKTLQKSF